MGRWGCFSGRLAGTVSGELTVLPGTVCEPERGAFGDLAVLVFFTVLLVPERTIRLGLVVVLVVVVVVVVVLGVGVVFAAAPPCMRVFRPANDVCGCTCVCICLVHVCGTTTMCQSRQGQRRQRGSLGGGRQRDVPSKVSHRMGRPSELHFCS